MISLVSPFFNVKRKYFIPFINSVLGQDFDDYELLIVNDESTDQDSLAMLAELNDPHIRVVNKPHGGVSHTRNWGVKEAKGDLMWMIDPDDEICENALKIIDSIFKKDSEIDLLVIGNNIRKGNGKIVKGSVPPAGYFTPEEGFASLCKEGHIVNGYAWTKVYNIGRIGKENIPSFSTQYIRYEDKIWNFKMMDIIKKGYAISDALYVYNFNPSGLSRDKGRRRELQDNAFKSYKFILQFVESKVGKTELYYEAMAFFYVSCFNDLSEWLFVSKKKDPGREDHKKLLLEMHNELKNHKIQNKRYSWRHYLTRLLLIIT